MSKRPDKPSGRKSSAPKKPAKGLLGVGLDNTDGHKRITKGEKFVLVGGSEETHGRMTETVVKTFEELKRRDKHLETVSSAELAEIIDKSAPR